MSHPSTTPLRYRPVALAVLIALSTTACGGGGSSNVRPDAPPPVVAPPPPPPPPTAPPPARFTGIADNHIVPTNVDRAHAAGFTGAGVGIGLLDSGANRSLPSLAGAIGSFTNYLSTDPTQDDVRGHGSVIAQISGGRAAPGFRGGVAPGSILHVARICSDAGLCSTYPVSTQATRDLLARGVRIFSHSFGTAGSVTVPDLIHSFRGVVTAEGQAANALFVWSAGNDSLPNPGNHAALPSQFPALARNWIAVTALAVNDRGEAYRLFEFSNLCGVAAQWCVGAPGAVAFLPTGGTIGNTGQGAGTSFAAPQIAGIAALVSQAFPWMGGDLLQLSILTTARDMGAPGVDARYGWGVADAERAVRGPAQFAFGDVTANVDRAGSWTWANAISGAGGLNKDGIGTLVLSGRNTYTGATLVRGGTLALNGGSLTSSVTVGSGASFESRAGSIAGDFTALAGSTTGLQIGGPLAITGTANLAGTANVLAPRSGYTIGGTETLLTAGRVQGTFERTTFETGLMFTGSLIHAADRVSVQLTRKSAAAVTADLGGIGSTLDGAQHFDTALAAADQGLASRSFLRAANRLLGSTDGKATLAGMQSLSGEIHGTARTALLATSDQVGRAIGSRLDGLEGGEAGGWVSFSQSRNDLEQRGFASAEARGDTLLAGLDGRFGEATVGALLGVGQAEVDVAGTGGRFDADRALVGVYAHQSLGAAYVQGSVTQEWLDVDVRRVAGADALVAQRDDGVFQARIEAGLSGTWSPYAALRYVRHAQGAFAETGGAFGFVAGEDRHESLHAELGLRYAHAFEWGGDAAFLAAHAAYQHRLSSGSTAFNARFAGVDAPFSARGQDLREGLGTLGVQFGHRFAPGWTWFAEAESEIAAGGVSGHRAGLAVRAEF